VAKRDRRRGISRLPVKAPTRWKAGFPCKLDYRGHDARFLGGFIGNIVSDHGGVGHLSRTQLHNLERAAYLALKIVQYESADLIPGSQPAPAWTPADYLGAVRQAQRLLADLGPGRKARNIGLREYIEQAAEATETTQALQSPAIPADDTEAAQ
jgi:hypothetical protein